MRNTNIFIFNPKYITEKAEMHFPVPHNIVVRLFLVFINLLKALFPVSLGETSRLLCMEINGRQHECVVRMSYMSYITGCQSNPAYTHSSIKQVRANNIEKPENNRNRAYTPSAICISSSISESRPPINACIMNGRVKHHSARFSSILTTCTSKESHLHEL